MKKTRRIQITAFRRHVTVYSGNERSEDANDPSPSSAESWQWIDASDQPPIDLAGNAILDTTRVDKVDFPGKAFRESEVNSSIASKNLGLRQRRLCRKLRSLGLSIRNLKTSLNPLREKQIKDKGQRTSI